VSDTESMEQLSQPEDGAGEAETEVSEEQTAEVEDAKAEVIEEQVAEVEAAEVEAVEEQAAEEQARPPLAFPDMDWYIIHTYSGFENKVKESLRTRADAFGFGDRIGEILIPTEDVVEMRSGKKVRTKRLLYPGYVLVQLLMDDELWHVVRNTPRVTSFVGSGQTPTPLTADEVNQILYRQTASVEKPRPRMTFEKNDRVKIIDGPFSNFAGSVEEVNEDRSTLKVMVTIFGRGTPVELEYFQVEKEKV
jgi:transcription termination/antitermination protein NusG